MRIKCWGCRGSIPVSGVEYLKYGGDTTCFEIRTSDNKIIIIDAGTGIRRLGNQLLSNKEFDYHILFTHAHWDHLLGFPYFKPIYHSKSNIKMYGCKFVQDSIREMLKKSMTPPYFPIDFDDIKSNMSYKDACEKTFFIGNTKITPILLSHPNHGVGFKFEEGNKTLVFITDNELTHIHPGGLNYNSYVEFCKDADLLIHDSEFLPKEYKHKKGWGHSVYTDSLQLAIDANVKSFGLIHHNQERTDDEIDEIQENCRKILNDKNISIDCFAVYSDMTIEI